MRILTQSELDKIKEDKEGFKKRFNALSLDKQKAVKGVLQNTYKAQNKKPQTTDGIKGYEKGQIVIPGVNTRDVNSNNNTSNFNNIKQTQTLDTNVSNNIKQTQTPTQNEIIGNDRVKNKNDTNFGDTFNNPNYSDKYKKYLEIQAKGNAGLKISDNDKMFYSTIKTRLNNSSITGETMYDILEMKDPKKEENKFMGVAEERRDLRASDLRKSLIEEGKYNENEIEKIVGYHKNYDDILIEKERIRKENDAEFESLQKTMQSQLEQQMNTIRQNGKKAMYELKVQLALNGAGRSDISNEKIQGLQGEINKSMQIAQSQMQSQLMLQRAQIYGADAEVLSGLQDRYNKYTVMLRQQQTKNAQLAADIASKARMSVEEGLKFILATSGGDEEMTDKLGYLATSDGTPILDENGQKQYTTKGRTQMYNEFKDGRNFEYDKFKDELNFKDKDRKFERDVLNDERKYGLDEAKFKYGIQKDNIDYAEKDRRFDLDSAEFNYKKEKDLLDYQKELDQEKQNTEDEYKVAKYAAEDAAEMIEEFNTLSGSGFLDRNLPSMSSRIERLRTSLAFMKVQDLKAQGVSMTPMTDADFENIRKSVVGLNKAMGQEEWNKEILRIQKVIKKGVSRRGFDIDVKLKGEQDKKDSDYIEEGVNQNNKSNNNDLSLKIQNDINRTGQGSKITGDIVFNASNKYNVNPILTAAFMRNDSHYGTKGLGTTNNNPGNVGQYDRYGNNAVAGFKTIEEGVEAVAKNLQQRILAYQKYTGKSNPTAEELAKGISKDGKKFFGVYMTDKGGPARVQSIYNQIIT